MLEELRIFWDSDPRVGQHSTVYIFSAIAAHLKKRLIGFHYHLLLPLAGNNPDQIGVDEGADACLALTQGFLNAFLIVNVGRGAEPFEYVSVLISEWGASHQKSLVVPCLALAQAIFDFMGLALRSAVCQVVHAFC